MSTSPVGSSHSNNPFAFLNGGGSAAATAGSTPATGSPGASSGNIGGLTMANFLTLMTAQLKNQDPLNPTDSNQFLNQLSELSTVEGIAQMNTSMNTLSNSMLSSQALASVSLVGKGVLAQADAANYASGQTLGGAVDVPTGATGVTLSITNGAGVLVDQIAVPANAGMQSFRWNGQQSNGQPAPSGAYNVIANAIVGGKNQAATTYISGTVSSITLGATGQSPTLNTPELGPVLLSSVQQID